MKNFWRALAILGAVVLVAEAIAACGPDQPGLTKDTDNPVSWQTPNVSLAADDFWIEADGRRFTAQNAVVGVDGDPGGPGYTSLELSWGEMGRVMLLNIYFKTDGNHWWSDEIRTYDGQVQGEWLYYLGTFFKTPLGSPFKENIDLPNNGPKDRYGGSLHFKNLRLSPTFKKGPIPTEVPLTHSCIDNAGNVHVWSPGTPPPLSRLPADCKYWQTYPTIR